MKGYGTTKETKVSRHVEQENANGGVDEYYQFDGSYNWRDVQGTVTLVLENDGKKVTLLKLSMGEFKKLVLTVRADEEIEEIQQKQLELGEKQ